MSYCHITEVGINLMKGFGEWPGDKIRERMAAAQCLKNRGCGACKEDFFRDADGDGYGCPDDKVNVQDCTAPEGYVDNDLDCNDNDNTVGAKQVYYEDIDGDGYGNLDV